MALNLLKKTIKFLKKILTKNKKNGNISKSQKARYKLFNTIHRCVWEDLNDTVMSGGVELRVNIQLECTECKRRNYSTSKNKKNTTERLEINKYCKWDKKVTLHKETKK